jgi:hypothetical protein
MWIFTSSGSTKVNESGSNLDQQPWLPWYGHGSKVILVTRIWILPHIYKINLPTFIVGMTVECCGSGMFLSRIRIRPFSHPISRFFTWTMKCKFTFFLASCAFRNKVIVLVIVKRLIPDPDPGGKKSTGSRIRNTGMTHIAHPVNSYMGDKTGRGKYFWFKYKMRCN